MLGKTEQMLKDSCTPEAKEKQRKAHYKPQESGYFGDGIGSGTEDAMIRKGPTWGFEGTGGYTRICFYYCCHLNH